jgi:hypothetical protein
MKRVGRAMTAISGIAKRLRNTIALAKRLPRG